MLTHSPKSAFHHYEPKSQYFADDISLNEKSHILIHISPKFVPENAIDIESAMFQVMAWHQMGNKPLTDIIYIGYIIINSNLLICVYLNIFNNTCYEIDSIESHDGFKYV